VCYRLSRSMTQGGRTFDMRRREFISLLGGAATFPLAARAHQPALPVVGYLNIGSTTMEDARKVSFQEGLREQGFVEGRNFVIESRYASTGDYEGLLALANDLVPPHARNDSRPLDRDDGPYPTTHMSGRSQRSIYHARALSDKIVPPRSRHRAQRRSLAQRYEPS
jgi:hypothetical protein